VLGIGTSKGGVLNTDRDPDRHTRRCVLGIWPIPGTVGNRFNVCMLRWSC